MDMTDRRRAESELRDSEAKFAAAFHASPNLMAITRAADGTILEVNEGYTRLLGYSHAESIGRTTAELSIWADAADRAAFTARLRERGEVTDLETRLRRKDGSLRTVIDSARTIELQGETCILSVAYDITERKRVEVELTRLNRALRMQRDANRARVRATVEETLLNEVCRIAVDVGGYCVAWVGFAESDAAKTLRPVARAGPDSGYLESATVSWGEGERGRGPGGTAIRTGRPCVVRDIALDPTFAPWREAAVQRGYRSVVALPLTEEDERYGALVVYARETDVFDAKEVEILAELADDLSFGITALRTRARRDRSEEALRKREVELSEAQRLAHIGSWDWDAVKDTIWWSPEYYRIYGRDPSQPTPNYADHLQAYTAESARRLDVAVKRAMETGEPYEVDLEFAEPSGSTRWVVARGEATRDADGRIRGLRGTAQDITERKLVAAALQKSEALYRCVVAGMMEGVCLQAPSGEILAVNSAAERIEGRSAEEMLGRTLGDLQLGAIGEDGAPLPDQLHPSMVSLRTGEPQKNALMGIHRPDGTLVWLSVNAQPLIAEGIPAPMPSSRPFTT